MSTPFYLWQPQGSAGMGDATNPQAVPGVASVIPAISPASRLNNAQCMARQVMFTHPRPNYWEAPKNARPIETSSQPFVAFPDPGAAAVNVLQYQVPLGFRGFIRWMAIVAVGGGFIDGVGNVIWRIKRNSVWVQGYEYLTAQIGSWSQPNDAILEVQENELYTVTVEIATGAPVQSGTTGARFRGWLQPLNQHAQQ